MSQSQNAGPSASGQKIPIIPFSIYDRARSYIEHEDELVNYRTTWMLTINGFLFAGLGWILPKLIEEITRKPSDANALHMYFLFVLALCLVGFVVSLVASLALAAAYAATAAIKEICDKAYVHQTLADHGRTYEVFQSPEGLLPMVTRGGARNSVISGAIVRFGVSGLFLLLWPIILVGAYRFIY